MKKTLAIILATVLTMFLYCSCGKSAYPMEGGYNYDVVDSMTESGEYGWADEAFDDIEMDEPMAAPMAPAQKPAGSANSVDSPTKTEEKIIRNGSIEIETLEYNKFLSELEASVSTFGGYIENSDQRGREGYRYANYTVRVPAESYDSFVRAVGDMGTVTSSSESVTNVTLQYVDIEARLSALTAERDSFMKLMDRAETIDEILQIQSYLTDVNYQIESYTSQLNTLKNKVSYSTVRVNISEVERVTPPEPKTVGERIVTQFSQNIYNISEGSKDFAVWFVSSLPYLAIYAVIIVIAVVIIKKASKNHRKKQAEQMAAYNARYGLPQNPQASAKDSSDKSESAQ